MLRDHAPDERPWLVISGIEMELLAACGDHLVIAKTEGFVATANSAICTTDFPFAQITHVGHKKAPVGGTIQVRCGPNDGPYTRAEKPRVIDPNCLPIPKKTFIHATPSINEPRLRIWGTQPDAVANHGLRLPRNLPQHLRFSRHRISLANHRSKYAPTLGRNRCL
jgi:hypothetical protein